MQQKDVTNKQKAEQRTDACGSFIEAVHLDHRLKRAVGNRRWKDAAKCRWLDPIRPARPDPTRPAQSSFFLSLSLKRTGNSARLPMTAILRTDVSGTMSLVVVSSCSIRPDST